MKVWRGDGVFQHMRHDTVDHRVAAPAFLIGRPAAIADAGDGEAMLDEANRRFVAGEPGDGADGAGREQEAVAEARVPASEMSCQQRQERQTGAIVVGQRGVADMGGEQEFVLGFAAMMFNLFFINMVVSGLHSYAGLN